MLLSFVSIHRLVHCQASQAALLCHRVRRSRWLPEFTCAQMTVTPPVSTRASELVLFVCVFVLFSVIFIYLFKNFGAHTRYKVKAKTVTGHKTTAT